jgi:hypothetical protein
MRFSITNAFVYGAKGIDMFKGDNFQCEQFAFRVG